MALSALAIGLAGLLAWFVAGCAPANTASPPTGGETVINVGKVINAVAEALSKPLDRRVCPAGTWVRSEDAEWVARVLEAAGTAASGCTGSALIADVGGRDLYIWAFERATGESAWPPEPGFTRLGTVGGVDVWGASIRAAWRTGTVIVWIEAKTGILPPFERYSPLVAASDRVPFGRPDGWTRLADDENRLAIAVPPGWNVAEESLTPALVDPHETLSLGTFALRVGSDRCAHVPELALEELGPEDAFVSIQERAGAAGDEFVSRPAQFGPTFGTGYEGSDIPECLDPPKDFFLRWIPFQDQGRAFYALVAAGNAVSSQTIADTWRILDSLQVEPR